MTARSCLALPMLAMLAACGSAGDDKPFRQPRGTDPAQVAGKLSLGGREQAEAGGAYLGAVNCAAAIQVTVRTLQTMRTGSGAQETEMFARATDIFRSRAAAAEDAEGRKPAADIDRAVRDGMKNPPAQAQLAIACLRLLESDT